jgi:hypothetical protein
MTIVTDLCVSCMLPWHLCQLRRFLPPTFWKMILENGESGKVKTRLITIFELLISEIPNKVCLILLLWNYYTWYLSLVLGVKAAHVYVEDVPCCATTMNIITCLQDPSNGIVRNDGWLVQCPYDEIDSYPVTDELRNVRTRFSYNIKNYVIGELYLYLCR